MSPSRYTPCTETREQLIELCERAAATPVDRWSNRDSARATMQLGVAWALLKSGAEFSAYEDDRQTIWVHFDFPGFEAFEYDPRNTTLWESERCYLPSRARVDSVAGGDWY